MCEQACACVRACERASVRARMGGDSREWIGPAVGEVVKVAKEVGEAAALAVVFRVGSKGEQRVAERRGREGHERVGADHVGAVHQPHLKRRCREEQGTQRGKKGARKEERERRRGACRAGHAGPAAMDGLSPSAHRELEDGDEESCLHDGGDVGRDEA